MGFDMEYCISGGSTFFEVEYLKKWRILVTKNIAGSKKRLIKLF